MRALEAGDADEALRQLYHVDNNAYAFNFDEAVYNHFSAYVYDQPRSGSSGAMAA